MSGERIVQVVEIDIDQCTRTWGSSPCLAEFRTDVVRKCYNSFPTCTYKQAYNKGTNTLKFIEASFPLPGQNYIPALLKVTGREQSVNIAGFSSDSGGLGVRAKVTVSIADFPDRDLLTDKYWNGRISGSAQTNEGGYDPLSRGTFWTKFKSRNQNYNGRPLRVIQAEYNAAGNLVYRKVRHYVIDTINGPQNSGQVTIVAKDVLALAEDDRAIAPMTSLGVLLDDITSTQSSFQIAPTGYPTSGHVTVGSEIMSFTRSGGTMTVTRGVLGTSSATHSAGDAVQLAFHVNRVRADSVIRDLLVNYARIPASYITFSEWQSEFDKWGATMILSATICKPTGVATLISEINQLGITVWWDEIAMKIRIKLNHPPEETPVSINDRDNNITITQVDNEEERTTRVSLWSVQIDPTKGLSVGNFSRNYITVFVDGENVNFYNEETTKTINTRWLNHGSNASGQIITGRLLLRYRNAPNSYTVELDAKDDLQLTQVVSLKSHVVTDVTGLETPILAQVFYRADTRAGSKITAKLQRFLYDARYGSITENSRPNYNASSADQKRRGVYMVGATLVFDDGSPAYRFI